MFGIISRAVVGAFILTLGMVLLTWGTAEFFYFLFSTMGKEARFAATIFATLLLVGLTVASIIVMTTKEE